MFHAYTLFRQEPPQLLQINKSTRCLECHLAPILAKLIPYFCAVSACISRRIQVRETFNKTRFRCESAFVFSNSTRPRPPGIWTFLKTRFFTRIQVEGTLTTLQICSDSLIRVKMYVKISWVRVDVATVHFSSADEFKSSGDLIPLCKVYCST